MTAKLSDALIETYLAALPSWTRSGTIIIKRVTLPSFPAALLYINAVGHLAEAAGHHPDILVQWKTVTISISTHDAGGLTEKDFQLARQIEALPLK